LVVAGCSRSPEAQKARYLERGDKYAAREQYKEAILEYSNVLRLDPTNQRATTQLGLLHYRLEEWAQAFAYLRKAAELVPDNLEVRVKLGTIYFLGGDVKNARREIEFILERDPKNLDSLVLLGNMAITPEEVDAAIPRLEKAQAELGDRA